jgi:cytochrome c biogenesis protein CcdA/thiol-disulfide isomerase/thioredoxin
MLAFLVAYAGGLLTVLSPCILPVLPFVFAPTGRPFASHGLPMLAGLALAFAAVASLAAAGGAWAVSANVAGRGVALALLAAFGMALLFPALAARAAQPLAALGAGRLARAPAGVLSSALLGVGTGLLWAPCAGPILGAILTGAAIRGANLGSSLLLLAYAAGASSALALALLGGQRLLARMRAGLRAAAALRRAAGGAIVLGAGFFALGLDARLPGRAAPACAWSFEAALARRLQPRRPEAAQDEPPAAAAVPAALREPAEPPLPDEGALPPLSGATGWINSPPLTREALRGKVVLVDFWTYSCINCLRTLPYVRAWAEKYKDEGLVVIGVHTPEFAFEKQPANVAAATRDLGVGFAVALDSDYAVWRAFGNAYWPAFYFVDARGRVRHHHFGEGGYAESERVLRRLLAEAGRPAAPAALVAPVGEGTQASASPGGALSQETYLGWGHASEFASPGGIARDRLHTYAPAASLGLDQWALAGDWTVEAERAVLERAGGRIAIRFHARDLHLVLGPGAGGRPVRFRVRVDGRPPQADHGTDVDAEGNGTIVHQRLYQLVRRSAGDGERLFEIEFLDAGAQAHVFTFG